MTFLKLGHKDVDQQENKDKDVNTYNEEDKDKDKKIFPSHTIVKICFQNYCALQLDSRSKMVITDLLFPEAPWVFLLAILGFISSSSSFYLSCG